MSKPIVGNLRYTIEGVHQNANSQYPTQRLCTESHNKPVTIFNAIVVPVTKERPMTTAHIYHCPRGLAPLIRCHHLARTASLVRPSAWPGSRTLSIRSVPDHRVRRVALLCWAGSKEFTTRTRSNWSRPRANEKWSKEQPSSEHDGVTRACRS